MIIITAVIITFDYDSICEHLLFVQIQNNN